MPISLKKIPTKDLLFVLNCKNFREIANKYGQGLVNEYIKEAKHLIDIEINKYKITQSLMSFSDGPNYPMLALWGILEVITLAFLPLSILTGLVLLFVLGLATIYFYSTYQELSREAEKNLRFFILADLKQKCADELINRFSVQIEKTLAKNNNEQSVCHVPPIPTPANIQNKLNKNYLPRLRNGIGTSLVITTTLAGTYYFGTSTILTAYGLTTLAGAMLGPVGLIAAFASSFVIGAYFGYKFYQACKNEEIIEEKQKQVTKITEQKRQQCIALKSKLDELNQTYELKGQHKEAPVEKQIERPPILFKKMAKPESKNTYRVSFFPMLLANKKHRANKHQVKDTKTCHHARLKYNK